MKPFPVWLLLSLILILTLFMFINPGETVNAAGSGMKLWYSTIVPALLPFFIVTELLVSIHFVKLLGVILEPIMRPIFRLPGCSSLVLVMGFTSGFPMGAVLCSRLYEQHLLTREEVQRLVSFTNNCSPLFVIGAVGMGMFGSATIGYLLAAAHYLSNLGVGLLWSILNDGRGMITPSKSHQQLVSSAVKDFLAANRLNTGGIGQLMTNAVSKSIGTLLSIAGFIVLFSVLARMLTVWGVLDNLAHIFVYLFGFCGVSYQHGYSLATGLFEITIGLKTLITFSPGTSLINLIIASIILSFSGLSIITQVMSVIAEIHIRWSFYLLSRLLQMIFATVITIIGYYLVIINNSVQSFTIPVYKVLYAIDAWSWSIYCFIIGCSIIAVMTVIGLLYRN
ncbi:MAG: sporulation integral membrane protein YlbJ [Syntrophomonadaceae bacterium]|nr:sporulation integral membrane protein YlbJ [Syntrophomonadaceae bacterium]